MLLTGSPALLLACVTYLLFWPLQQATTIIYRGCAYSAVVGKEHALWFCLADNLCAMFHCQDNKVFSLDDCGCVPPHRRRNHHHHHHHHHSDGKSGSGGGGGGSAGVSVSNSNGTGGGGGESVGDMGNRRVTMTTAPRSTTPPVVLSAGSSIITSPVPQLESGSGCQREIHIDGLIARAPGVGDTQRNVYIEPRGVIDLGNGSAFYDGYSYLSVPMYSNANFDQGFTVDFILQEGTSTLRQVLMTNCKHGQGASVEIVLDVELGVLLFHVMYRFRDAVNAVESVVEVAVPYTPFVPKRVALTFDGQRLSGRVNQSQRSASVQGNGNYVLARRAKPLMFGNTLCDVDDVYSYRGQIKQISVYRCAKNITDLFS